MPHEEKRKMVRRLRHWKQRYDRNAEFIWRRTTVFGGERFQVGDKIPEQLKENPAKLRRFWESKRIELADFEAPNVATGQVEDKTSSDDVPEGVTVTRGKGSWYLVTNADGEEFKANGKNQLKELLEYLAAAPEDEESDDKPEDESEDEEFLK